MQFEVVGHSAQHDDGPRSRGGAGGGGSARAGQPQRSAKTLIVVGVISSLALCTFAVFAVERQIAAVEVAAQKQQALLKAEISSVVAKQQALVEALQASESRLRDAARGGVDDVEAAAKKKVEKAAAALRQEQQDALDAVSEQLEDNVSSVRQDVEEVKSQVKSLDSSVSKIREKLAQTPEPPSYVGRNIDFQSAMQRPPPPPPDDGGGQGWSAPYNSDGGASRNLVKQPIEPAPPQPPMYQPGFQQRSANAPALQVPFSDIEDVDLRNRKRREMIQEEFAFAWNAYRRYAWGRDELKPISKTYKDWQMSSKGIGLTIFDSMSTLALLNMTEDLNAAIHFVLHEANFEQHMRISAFEATIRMVAGLLSVFELTGESDRRLVDRAEYVMSKLLWAYNTSSGVPHQQVNLKTHKHWCPDWTSGGAVLSEFGSIQLELRTLSYHTKNPLYDMRATHIMDIVEQRCTPDMLCPTYIDVASGLFRDDHVTLGALGDSFYEYLVKQYLLTGRTETRYREDALSALDGVVRRLLKYSSPSRQAYLAEYIEGQMDHRMDELACFAGGMFALAAMEIPDTGRPKEFGKIAMELTETCYKMWAEQDTGLAPESVEFPGGGDFVNGPAQYLLRPETLESLFYVWRLTKDEKWRDMAWNIFAAMHQYCRVPTGGYTGIKNVAITPPEPDDVQQSFLFAETFKYLYLIFSDDSVLPLDKWVLNTEAHPLRIRERNPMDIWTEWEEKHGGLPWDPPTLPRLTKFTATEKQKKVRELNPSYHVVAPIDPLAVEEPDPDEEYRMFEAAKEQAAAAAAADERRRAAQEGPTTSSDASMPPPTTEEAPQQQQQQQQQSVGGDDGSSGGSGSSDGSSSSSSDAAPPVAGGDDEQNSGAATANSNNDDGSAAAASSSSGDTGSGSQAAAEEDHSDG